MRDTNELRRLLGQVEQLRRPTPVRDRQGRLRRNPAGEWDWFYCLDDGLRRWLQRARVDGRPIMSDSGLAPDDLASLVGLDDVEHWAEQFVSAARVARDRAVADEWDDDVRDDDDDLIGPDELAELLQVDRSTVRQWRHRSILPAPDFQLSELPIWTVRTIRDWASLTGRTVDLTTTGAA